MAGVTGENRVSPNKNLDPTQEIQEIQLIQPTGDLLTMCTLELEIAYLDQKNTPVDPDPFSSLFFPACSIIFHPLPQGARRSPECCDSTSPRHPRPSLRSVWAATISALPRAPCGIENSFPWGSLGEGGSGLSPNTRGFNFWKQTNRTYIARRGEKFVCL